MGSCCSSSPSTASTENNKQIEAKSESESSTCSTRCAQLKCRCDKVSRKKHEQLRAGTIIRYYKQKPSGEICEHFGVVDEAQDVYTVDCSSGQLQLVPLSRINKPKANRSYWSRGSLLNARLDFESQKESAGKNLFGAEPSEPRCSSKQQVEKWLGGSVDHVFEPHIVSQSHSKSSSFHIDSN